MPTWTFWDFVDDAGKSEIQKWIDSLPPEKRTPTKSSPKSKLLAVLEVANAVGELKGQRFEVLERPYRDIIRIGWERGGVAYRVFACYGNTQPPEIWLLAGGTEHNNNYRPPGILDTAMQRRAAILQDRRRVRRTWLLTGTN